MDKDLKQGLALGVAFAALVSVMPSKAHHGGGDDHDHEKGERCIPSLAVRNVDVQDRNTLRFEMISGDVYINRLSGSLSNSFGMDPLVFDHHYDSAQYCKFDSVGLKDRFPRNDSMIFTASLGRFEKVIQAL